MRDEKTKALEKLIASCSVIIHIGEQGDHPKGCQCDECVDARTCTLGIEAIREMQAELAGRDTAPEKEAESRGLLDWTRQEWCDEAKRLKKEIEARSAGRKDEYLDVYVQVSAENERLKEELRITKNSWNFEEGKRIIAERDKAEGKVIALQDKLRTAEEAADVAEGKRYATYAGRSVRVWYEEVVRLRGLMSEAKKLIDQGSCDD